MRKALAVAAIALAFAPSALAAKYTIVPVGPPGAWGVGDINNSNQVVGDYVVPGPGGWHAFLYSGGTSIDLGTLGGFQSFGRGINDSGVVVGESQTAAGPMHPFSYSGGTMTDLGAPPGTSNTQVAGINNAGEIVGNWDGVGFVTNAFGANPLPSLGGGSTLPDAISSIGDVVGASTLPNGQFRAFLYSGVTMRNLGTLAGHVESRAHAVNDAGLIVGYSRNAMGHKTAVAWAGSTIIALPGLPSGSGVATTEAFDVNVHGVIVGSSSGVNGGGAVLWSGGSVTDLSTQIPAGTGWVLGAAIAINDNGWIVGTGTYNLQGRAFLLIPNAADTTAPTISCGSADGAWHAANVSIACTATDSGTGLANPADASFSLLTSVAAGTETANASTGTRSVCDNAANCATAGPIAGNKIDRRGPSITITSPLATRYVFASLQHASYACTDGGSGNGACTGTVAGGSAFDTTTPGVHTFTVDASDAVGNTSTATVSYAVLATDWAQFRNGPGGMGLQPSEYILDRGSVAGLAQSWSFKTNDPVMSSPAVADGVLYVGDDNGTFFAIEASTGKVLAKAQAGNLVRSSPAVGKRAVVVGSADGNVYAFERRTLAPLWTFRTGGAVYSSPVVDGNVVYVGSDDGNVYALDEQTGRQIWSQYLGGPVEGSPAVDRGVVYVGGDDFYALDAATGQFLWTASFGVAIRDTAAVSGPFVFVGTPYGLYALERSSGATIWFAPTRDQITDSPATDGASVVVGAMDGNLYAFDAGSGASLWSTYLGSGWVSSSPAFANGVVYVGTSNGWLPGGSVAALDASSGGILWSFATNAMVNSSPAVADGRVYVGSDDNNVYAFGL